MKIFKVFREAIVSGFALLYPTYWLEWRVRKLFRTQIQNLLI